MGRSGGSLSDDRIIRVVHVITGLRLGGVERILEQVVTTGHERFRHHVIALEADGAMEERLRRSGVDVRSMGLRKRPTDLARLWALRRVLAFHEPDVVQTWMYHGNVLGGLAALGLGVPIAWALHHTTMERDVPASTRLLSALGARLSWRVPRVIVVCGPAVREEHGTRGYDLEHVRIVPNGVPVTDPDSRTAANLRTALGIPANAPVVGRVGRYAPQKDYPSLLAALALVLGNRPDTHAVLVGPGVESTNRELARRWRRTGVADRIHLLGARDDVAQLHAMFDLEVSSSTGEAWPLVIAEALMAGTPVVATDVGDSAAIVGGSGRVVPPRDPVAMAAAVTDLLEGGDLQRLGRQARRRAQDRFSVADMVAGYEECWLAVGGFA